MATDDQKRRDYVRRYFAEHKGEVNLRRRLRRRLAEKDAGDDDDGRR
jgi:hypothetical protein